MDAPEAGYDAVAGNALFGLAEVLRAVLDEFVDLLEGAFIEEQFQPLAGREFALGVLARAALLAATGIGLGVASAEFVEFFLQRHKNKDSVLGTGDYRLNFFART